METRGYKVNINKTKLMVMGSDPALRPQRGSGVGNLRRAADNFRCPTCVRGVVAVLQRLGWKKIVWI